MTDAADAPRPKLSARLNGVTDAVRRVTEGMDSKPCLADIGCDHALVPVDLLLTGDIARAVASDLREGPLRAAEANAANYGVSARMRVVCADGFAGLETNEAEIAVIAGMGGELTARLLRNAGACGIKYLVLSPHTKTFLVRSRLQEIKYQLSREEMIDEDGKYYPVLTAKVPDENTTDYYDMVIPRICTETGVPEADALRICLRFGPLLLSEKHPVCRAYLGRQQVRVKRILDAMGNSAHAPSARREELLQMEGDIETALRFMRKENGT